MNRLFKFATLFATIASFTVLANEVLASSPTQSRYSNKLQTQQGTGSPAQSPTQSHRILVPPGGWKAIGGIFNQPHHILVPPGGWKAIGSIFNHPTPPTTPKPTPTHPTKGNGYGFGGGYFGGGTVVTAAPVASQPANTTTSDSGAASSTQVAAGSTFTLKGDNFGKEAGRVGVVVGGILVPVEVLNWSETAITVTLPEVGVVSTAKATFVVQRADGSTAKEMNFEMVAAK